MPRTQYAELPEPTACAVKFARDQHGPRLAASVSKHLGCAVTFAHWQAAEFRGGPETPVFNVPKEFHARATAMGLRVI